jgi:hypothetical protein
VKRLVKRIVTRAVATDVSEVELQSTVESALLRRRQRLPPTPAAVVALLQNDGAVLRAGPLETALLTVQGAVREAVFSCTGRETEMRLLWREALVTALCAGQLARLQGLSGPCAAMAGLLHRAGAALTLQTIAATELAQRRRIGATLRGQLAARHEPLLAAALLRAWKMPVEVAGAVHGWQKFSAVEPRRSAAMTVYVSHLLAAEMLQPEFFTPALIAGVAHELSMDSQHIAAVRAQGPALQRLIGAYSR